MMTKKESTKIVNLITPGAGVFVLGHGHIVNTSFLHIIAILIPKKVIRILCYCIMA